jgi:hypothetical protein
MTLLLQNKMVGQGSGVILSLTSGSSRGTQPMMGNTCGLVPG